ncbi:hypothetical protein OG417_25010 [Actinoallomurus sp. NBC_01490]|uniref:hypothetical protein n=1 Tax=Actinoallomurus sp. NBC_01490 TaxID=2903557 RepID=UPI002E371232|nr:hypothetical protein [Actinoallomurus sp. NBC_01490]
MGKAARNRRRRHERTGREQHGSPEQPSWWAQPTDVARGGTTEAKELAARVADAVEMPCRATFLDDPVFGGALNALLTGADVTQPPDPGGTTKAPPVLLFEPLHMMAMKDTLTGTVHELRTEALVMGGFHRLSGPVWSVELADGWGVYRTKDMVVLRNADGGVAAKSKLALDPAWESAAVSHGYVLVFHGHPLGVEPPPGKTEQTYTTRDRAMEFRQARYNGLLTGAVVKWGGITEDTLDWVLFPPGAFGLPLPLAYVPIWSFTPHGGPEAFGFTRLNKRVQAPFAEGMVAKLTTTDLDLVRPGEADRAIAFITGYHCGDEPANKQFFEGWRQMILDCGGLVIMTGNRDMPALLGASREQDQYAWEVMGESWGAKVLVSEDSKVDALATVPARPQEGQPREVIARAEHQAEYMQVLKDKLAGQESFSVSVDNALETLIDKAGLQHWITNLWPLACQTCSEPLGAKADISADGPFEDDKILLSMHHSGCRPSGVTPPEGVKMSCPTSSFVAGYLSADDKPQDYDLPVMVINPSCEQLQLIPNSSGGWRNATLEVFTTLGFAPPDGNFPPTAREVEAEVSGDYLIVTVTGYLPDNHDHEWAIKAPEHVLHQIRRLEGIAVSLVTKALPTLLGHEDLPSAFGDEDALIGWVPLAMTG